MYSVFITIFMKYIAHICYMETRTELHLKWDFSLNPLYIWFNLNTDTYFVIKYTDNGFSPTISTDVWHSAAKRLKNNARAQRHKYTVCTSLAPCVFMDASVAPKASFPASLRAPLCLFLADKSCDSGFLSTQLILTQQDDTFTVLNYIA